MIPNNHMVCICENYTPRPAEEGLGAIRAQLYPYGDCLECSSARAKLNMCMLMRKDIFNSDDPEKVIWDNMCEETYERLLKWDQSGRMFSDSMIYRNRNSFVEAETKDALILITAVKTGKFDLYVAANREKYNEYSNTHIRFE